MYVKEALMSSKPTRRTFLKGTAATAALAAVGTCSLGAWQAQRAEAADDSAKAQGPSLCNGCSSKCGLIATTLGGRLWTVEGMEAHPYSKGTLCGRGHGAAQWAYSDGRLTQPMKRQNDGSFAPISWDDAFAEIGAKVQEIIAEAGPEALAVIQDPRPSGKYYSKRFMNALGSANVYTHAAACNLSKESGIQEATGATNFSVDFANTKMVVFIGRSYGDGIRPSSVKSLAGAADAGARVVIVDPRLNNTGIFATDWVPIKPGTDPALGMAMLNAIIANEWYDLDFMREKTCAPLLVREDNGHFLRATDFGEAGPAELPEYPFFGTLLLQGVKAGKVPTLEETAHYVVWDADKDAWGLINEVANPAMEGSFEVNGVKVTTAWTLFKEHMAECTPEWAEGLTEVPADTIVELARMYSQDTPSTIYAGYHLYDNCEEMGMTWACLAALTGNIGKRGASIGHLGKSKPTINMAGLAFPTGLTTLNDEIPWLHLPELLETGKLKGEDFPVRLLYNIGANPVGSYAAQRKTIEEVLPQIPCIVTNDMEFSETCEYSDIVLPCAHYFEYDWIQASSHTPFLYMANKVADPIGEAKEDVEIFRAIAERMDNEGAKAFYAKTNEEMMRMVVDTELGEPLGINLDNLKEKGVLADRDENWIHWEDQRWPTLSGRLEFYVENPGARINIGKPIDKDFYHMPTYHTPSEAFDESEQHEKYPLYHYCERTRWHLHTQYNHAPILRELDPEPYLRMNPVDAEVRGIAEGDYVEAYNDRGHCVCKVKFDQGVRPGMVSSPKGWHRKAYVSGSYQELTNDHLNLLHMNTSFDDTLVEVRKYEGEVK